MGLLCRLEAGMPGIGAEIASNLAKNILESEIPYYRVGSCELSLVENTLF